MMGLFKERISLGWGVYKFSFDYLGCEVFVGIYIEMSGREVGLCVWILGEILELEIYIWSFGYKYV